MRPLLILWIAGLLTATSGSIVAEPIDRLFGLWEGSWFVDEQFDEWGNPVGEPPYPPVALQFSLHESDSTGSYGQVLFPDCPECLTTTVVSPTSDGSQVSMNIDYGIGGSADATGIVEGNTLSGDYDDEYPALPGYIGWRGPFEVSLSYTKALFQGLGDLPDGLFRSEALGVSGDGLVVVGTGYGASGLEAFRWTPSTGILSLGDSPGPVVPQEGHGASVDGSVIVGTGSSESGIEAFRWTEETGAVGLGDLPGWGFAGQGLAVSADGSIVVGASQSEAGWEAFRWSEESGMIGLGDLPGDVFYSKAYAVSGDGAVIAGISTSTMGEEAFRWTAENGMVALGDLPGGEFWSGAWGASGDGSVIVGGSDPGCSEAFRWTEGTGMVGIGTLPEGLDTRATAVSADGEIVVGFGAFIWDQSNGMRSLPLILESLGADLAGSPSLVEATDISSDGRTIVGWGFNADGFREGWIAVTCIDGDLSGNGVVDLADLGIFVNVLLEPSRAALANLCAADTNRDSLVDGNDVPAFLAALAPPP